MLVSGVVYTFIALLSMLSAIAAVLYGVYLVSLTVSNAMAGSAERASFVFLQAVAFALAAYTCTKFAHYMASRSMEMMDSRHDEDEWEEEYDDAEE
jgi:hypothetical protein